MTQEEILDIRNAVDVLNRGGVILYPTDTVWGLGCDATKADAVDKIYRIKRRADSKALISLVDSTATLLRYVPEAPEVALDMADLTTSPLTIIYDNASGLASNLTADDGSAAIRIPLDDWCVRLCRTFRRPLVSTSANISGQPAPRFFHEISEEIKSAVDYVCTTRRDDTTPRRPSGIIKISGDGTFRIIR